MKEKRAKRGDRSKVTAGNERRNGQNYKARGYIETTVVQGRRKKQEVDKTRTKEVRWKKMVRKVDNLDLEETEKRKKACGGSGRKETGSGWSEGQIQGIGRRR